MVNPNEQSGPEQNRDDSDDLNAANSAVSQFEDMQDIFFFLANPSSVEFLTAADLAILDQFATGTYTGHVTVETGGDYATDPAHLSLPSIISQTEMISVYRDQLDDFSEGPSVSPTLLPAAIETLATLGKTVIGVFRGPDEELANAEEAKILYVPSGGQISMTNNPE